MLCVVELIELYLNLAIVKDQLEQSLLSVLPVFDHFRSISIWRNRRPFISKSKQKQIQIPNTKQKPDKGKKCLPNRTYPNRVQRASIPRPNKTCSRHLQAG